MTTYRYKSDSVNYKAVSRFYIIGFIGGLIVAIVAAMPVIVLAWRTCAPGQWLMVMVTVAAVHITTWLVSANLMCATYQTMCKTNQDNPPPPPMGHSTTRADIQINGQKVERKIHEWGEWKP